MSVFDDFIASKQPKAKSVFDSFEEQNTPTPAPASEPKEKPSVFDSFVASKEQPVEPTVVKQPSVFDKFDKFDKDITASGLEQFEKLPEPVKDVAKGAFGAVETAASIAGGVLQFLNPIPGLAGIYEGVKTGSIEDAQKAIESTQQAFAPFMNYVPRTDAAKSALDKVQWLLDNTVVAFGDASGQLVENTLDAVGIDSPNITAALAASADITAELGSMALIGGGIGKGFKKLNNKVAAGEILTKQESIQFEKGLEEFGGIIEKISKKIDREAKIKAAEIVENRPLYKDLSSASRKIAIESLANKMSGKNKAKFRLRPISELRSFVVEETMAKEAVRAEALDAIKSGPLWNKMSKTERVQAVENLAQGLEGKTLPSPKITHGKLGGVTSVKVEKLKTTEPKGLSVNELVRKKVLDANVAKFDSELFINKTLETKFTELELEAITFIVQKIKDPNVLSKLGRDDLVGILKAPSKEMLAAAQTVGKYYKSRHKFLSKYHENVGYQENYVNQIWKFKDKKTNKGSSSFSTVNPFTKKRVIPSFEEGIRAGMKPSTLNIADLIRLYDNYTINSVNNIKFAEQLNRMTGPEGGKLLLPVGEAPLDWVKIDHPALSRTVYAGKIKGTPVLKRTPVAVPKEIAKELEVVFGGRWNNDTLRAVETINAFAKKGQLSLSLFHGLALTEAAFGSGVGVKALKLWNPLKIYKAIVKGDYEMFKNAPIARDFLAHEGTLGALGDVQRGVVIRALKATENATAKIPVAGKSAKLFRKANDLWDSGLWDYYHNSLKLFAYEENVLQSLKMARKDLGRGLSKPEITGIKNEMGKLTNDTFGGQNWELNKLLGTPKMQQSLQLAFLSPDWTYSTIRQALAPARGFLKMKNGKTVSDKIAGKMLMKRGASFWAKSLFYINTMAQAANMYTTKRDFGKARYTWENPPGHLANVYIGMNPDGTQRYARIGKQYKEVVGWFKKPLETLGGKLSPVLGEFIKQGSKHSFGSGYPAEFANRDMTRWQSVVSRAKSVGELFIPFSLKSYMDDSPGQFLFAVPTSKGMNRYKTIKLFEDAAGIKNSDKRRKAVQRITIAALENNLNAFQYFKDANANLKRKDTYEAKDFARDLFIEMRELDPTAKKEVTDLYRDRGLLTEKVMKEYFKLIRNDMDVQLQRKMSGIKKVKR